MKFLLILIKVSFSFVLGVVLYKNKNMLNKTIIKYIDLFLRLDLLKLILVITFIYLCLTFVIPYLYDTLVTSITIEAASPASDTPTPTSTSTPTQSSKSSSIRLAQSNGGDAAIMTAALATGAKLAQKAPTAATKAAIVVSSVGLGASAIIAKNFAGNLSSDAGKSSLVLLMVTNLSLKESLDKNYSTLIEYLYKLFDLTGNTAVDLLKMIDYLNSSQYIFIYFLIYLSILLSIDSSKIELILKKILPDKIVMYYMRSISLVQKNGRMYILILLFLLTYNIYLSNYCFNLLYENFDQICELYQSKK